MEVADEGRLRVEGEMAGGGERRGDHDHDREADCDRVG